MTTTDDQPATLTKDDAYALARSAVWTFEGYYKYWFSFTGKAEGSPLSLFAQVGGDLAEIYRYSAGPGPMGWTPMHDGCTVRLTVRDAAGAVLFEEGF